MVQTEEAEFEGTSNREEGSEIEGGVETRWEARSKLGDEEEKSSGTRSESTFKTLHAVLDKAVLFHALTSSL